MARLDSRVCMAELVSRVCPGGTKCDQPDRSICEQIAIIYIFAYYIIIIIIIIFIYNGGQEAH